MLKKGESIKDEPAPVINGATTFVSFILVGLVPLLSYTIDYILDLKTSNLFLVSTVLTAIAFVGIGLLKSRVARTNIPRAIAETLVLGALAAGLAYILGDFLERLIT
jgi:VIT1/CCC1 family predicted Fe2+/Mn2+ transporter